MPEEQVKKRFVINYIIKFWMLFAFAILSVVIFFFGVSNEWFGEMPSFEELENPKSNLASEIYSVDGKILGSYYYENRSNVDYRELSSFLINALVAAEDVRFVDHSGIDGRSLFRVAFGVVTGNAGKGGGSTITQQLAKNLFKMRERNPSTMQLIMFKFKEWVTAIKLERNYTKQEIIAMYLNTVAYGSQSFGIKSASKTFFDSSPDSLKIEEAALMVGVVNAPTRFSPVRNPERSFRRRNIVLSQMNKYGFITEAVYDSVSEIPIDMSRFDVPDHTKGPAKYFREFLRAKLDKWCETNYKPDGSNYDIYEDGLKIYTTIDSRLQQYAEEAVVEHLSLDLQPTFNKHWEGRPHAPFTFEGDSVMRDVESLMDLSIRRTERHRKLKKAGMPFDSIKMIFDVPVPMKVFSWQGMIDTTFSPLDSLRYYKFFLHSGLMSMEPHTGEVRAYVGGIDYNTFQYDHVTLGRRQVGSTFKPFLYTLAMQDGEFTPCSKLPNIQPRIELDNGDVWEPKNDGDATVGTEITLKYALATSNNWISGRLIKRHSPRAVRTMARKMGVKSAISPVYSIALGSADLKLEEMVGAMNTFASKGVYVAPIFVTHIEDKNGNEIASFIPEKNEAMSEETAYLMLELMKGVVQHGTGRRLTWAKYDLRNSIAGKTGTSNNQSDGWFMGITPQLTTGVWTGCEDRSAHFTSLTLGQGANMALPIWALYMNKIYADTTLSISKKDEFEPPLRGMNVEFDCDKFDKNRNQEVKLDENEEF